MRTCGICGINRLLQEDELETGMCRECMVNLFGDNGINNIAG